MTVIPLKRAFRTVVGGVWGEEATGTEHDVRCVRVADFDYPSLLVGERSVTYRSVPDTQLPNRLLKNGDLVIEKSGGGENTVVGRAVQWSSTARAITSNFMARLEPQPDHNGRYLTYVLAHLYFTGVIRRYIKQTTGIQNLDLHAYLQEKWDFPNKSDQTAIAAFLDHETARIDELVREQEHLLEEFRQKRQATVDAGVTGNLLKPESPRISVACIGSIPAHWEVIKLKRVAQVRGGVTKGRDLQGKHVIEVAYLRVANVQDGYLNLGDVATIEIGADELDRYSLRDGDVLMNEGGDNDKLGRGAVWRGQISPCIHQNHVFSVRPHGVDSDWLALINTSTYAKFYFFSNSKQSTNLASISSSNIKELPVVLPPQQEQQAILRTVNQRLAQIDALVAEVRANITDMQLLRSSLITAATTGKIDVRDWKPA